MLHHMWFLLKSYIQISFLNDNLCSVAYVFYYCYKIKHNAVVNIDNIPISAIINNELALM